MGQLPKARLQDFLKAIHINLEGVIYEEDIDQLELAILVWLLSDIKPTFRVCRFRCDTFGKAIDMVCARASRVKEKYGVGPFESLVKAVTDCSTPADVFKLAMRYGFQRDFADYEGAKVSQKSSKRKKTDQELHARTKLQQCMPMHSKQLAISLGSSAPKIS